MEQSANSLKVYSTAEGSLGQNLSPRAPDEYGCADTCNQIFKRALGWEIGGDVSTYRMYESLKKDKKFMQVYTPLPGDICISPTGWGNGKMKSGHVGIVGVQGKILSNNSKTGKLDNHWTIDTWKKYYKDKGGFPVCYFRVL